MKSQLFILFLFVSFSISMTAQTEIKLYPNGPADSNGITTPESVRADGFVMNISAPRMYYYPVPKKKATGAAVLICPGGAYMGVSVIKEGEEIAKWFNELGVPAFVLYYRMPNGHATVPLADAQTALSIIRRNACTWHISKNKIGIMGFSAGGHLASTVGTHFQTKKQRPAFMILGYPVVTMQNALTHKGSQQNLLGNDPSPELLNLYSNELQVTTKTPPTFIIHASNDKAVPVKNSIQLYNALLEKKIEAELDTFALGGHGFGMRKSGIPADNWPDLLKNWLQKNKLIQ